MGVVAPYSADAVAGVFWAHSGPFRNPQKGDSQACKAASNLKSTGGKLQVFEFAGFPFDFYWSLDELKAWSSALHAGGYKASDHFRVLNGTEFLSVLESDVCTGGISTLVV